MKDEKEGSEFGQFGALITKQHAMVNAFVEMVKNGQTTVQSEVPRHNEGVLPQEEGNKMDSNQVENIRKANDKVMEMESLRVELQHYLAL